MRGVAGVPHAGALHAHVLVAVDTSSTAEDAARLGIELAYGQPHAWVTFCHVLDVPRMVIRAVDGVSDYESEFTAARAAARMTLERCVELARERGFRAPTCVRYGNPATQIAAFARSIGADLIVIGNRRTTKLHRLLCGSTRDQLVRESPIPVLVTGAR